MILTRHITFSSIFFAFLFSCGDCGDPEDNQTPPLTQGEWNQEICDSEEDEDGDGRISCADSDCFTRNECVFVPDDPMSTRPEISENGFTPFWDRYAFLFESKNAIHRGLDGGLVNQTNISIISGRIVDIDAKPLEGAAVFFANRPEFGRTYTRSDGRFDLALDGNSRSVIRVSKKGFITSDRRPNTKPFVASGLEEIVLVALQTDSTLVDFSEPKWVSGDLSGDESGERTTSVYFPAGTKAKLVFPNGATEKLDSISFHINEVTQGENGRGAMMADLPPRTLYTYAVEFSVKEAIEKNAEKVVFDEPVFMYVDNFLGFPAGTIVPSGFYDRNAIAWEPMPDGLILKVTDIKNGIALLEFDTGLSEAERREIAKHYEVGDSFWRVPTKHFSPFDLNWGGPYPPGTQPSSLPGDGFPPDCAMGQEKGSIIGCPTQTLGEQVALNGTPFVLSYRTSRSKGYKAVLEVPVNPFTLTENILVGAKVRVSIAGQKFEREFSKSDTIPPIESFIWDGKDQFGRLVQGSVEAEVEVYLAYQVPIRISASGGSGLNEEEIEYPPSFGINAEAGVQVQLERGKIFIRRRYTRTLTAGTFDVQKEGLGGWTLNVHHRYDPIGRAIYYGDGRDQFARTGGKVEVIAGNTSIEDDYWVNDLDGLKSDSYLTRGQKFAVLPDGSILFLYPIQPHAIYKIDKETRMISLFAGAVFDKATDIFKGDIPADYFPASEAFKERNNDSGSGGPLKDVRFATISDWGGLKVGRDGRLYVLTEKHLWKIEGDSAEIIMNTTTGKDFSDGADSKDTGIHFSTYDVAADGTVFFNALGIELFKRTPDGRIRFITNQIHKFGVQENCKSRPCAENESVSNAYFQEILDIAVNDEGEIFIIEKTQVEGAEQRQTFIRKVGSDGILRTIAEGGDRFTFSKIDVGPAGELYTTLSWGSGNDGDTGGGTGVLQVLQDGTLKPRIGSFSNFGGFEFLRGSIDGDSASRPVSPPHNFDVALNGDIYVSTVYQLLKRTVLLPTSTKTDFEIPSPSGQEVYVFTKEGIHLKTYEVNTGHVIWSFEYNQSGRLISLIDRDGDKTSINRDSDENPVSITGPNGVTWRFSTEKGALLEITSPENETYKFRYSEEGLMLSMQTPRGEQSEFIYDAAGRLTTDIQPNGGVSTLEKNSTSSAVSFKSAEGRQTRYGFSSPTSPYHSNSRRTGDLSSRSYSVDGWTFSNDQTGLKQRSRNVSHPIFGPISSYADTSIIDLPSGLTGTMTTEFSATLATSKLRDGLEDWSVISKNMDRITTVEWDRASSVLSAKTGGGRTASVKLDDKARPITLSSPEVVDTKLEYDIQGRPSKILRDTRQISFQYNAQGYTESVTAADGTVKYSRDKMGRVLVLERKDATTAGFTYDPWGYLTSITPPGADPYTMEYDNRGNMTFMNSPNATRTQYEYDLDHRPIKMTQGDGRDIRLSYDDSNRVKEINADGSVYIYNYVKDDNVNDAIQRFGQLESVAGGAVNIAYTWDGPLLKTQTYSGAVSGSLAIDYNQGTLDLKSMDINGTKIDIDYDIDGVPVKVGDLNLAFHSGTTRLSRRAVASMTTSFSYNTFGEPKTIETSDGLLKEEFTYDGLGRIATLTRTAPNGIKVYEYTYDLLGQITEVKIDGNVSESYTYDENGNRTSATGVAASRIRYDEDERMERYDSNTYTYNDAGQLKIKTRSGNTTTYNYSVTGRLKSVDLENGKTIAYQHDALDRRISRKSGNTITQRFLYGSGLGPIAEVDAAGNTISTFIYGTRINVPDYMIRNGKTYYFVHDYLGSVRAVVDVVSGNVEQEIDYDTFGQVLSDSNPGYQPFGFAGGLYDHETKLVRFGARDYDAQTGRWTAPDRIGFNGGQFNLYVYVNSDAVNFIDPTGFYTSFEFLVDLSNFSAGFGDTLTLGGTAWVRHNIGVDSAVNKCSGFYKTGGWATFLLGAGRLAYAGTVKGVALISRTGALASARRNTLKKIFRLNPFSTFRVYPYSKMLKAYKTDLAVKAAAGRTSAFLNRVGAGATIAGGTQALKPRCGCK